MTKIRFSTKADFVAALKARRKDIEAHDRRKLAEYREAEKVAMAEFRAEARRVAKLSDGQLREWAEARWSRNSVDLHLPDKPRLLVPALDRLLRALDATTQGAHTVTPDETAYHLLAGDLTAEGDR